jgi:hypothetical protein
MPGHRTGSRQPRDPRREGIGQSAFLHRELERLRAYGQRQTPFPHGPRPISYKARAARRPLLPHDAAGIAICCCPLPAPPALCTHTAYGLYAWPCARLVTRSVTRQRWSQHRSLMVAHWCTKDRFVQEVGVGDPWWRSACYTIRGEHWPQSLVSIYY